MLAWALARLVLGADYSLDALRDVAPFAYVATCYLVASSFARAQPEGRARTMRFIEVALLLHLAWCLPARLLRGIEPRGFDAGVELFVLRFDTDGTILGVTACLFLLRLVRSGGWFNLTVVVTSLALMLSMTSRAALLATTAALVLTMAFLVWSGQARQRGALLVGLAPLLVLGVLAVLPSTEAGSKLLTTIGVAEPTSEVDAGGIGTASARWQAWGRVIDYTRESSPISGVGFGPQFMNDSGANTLLVGAPQDAVRSPHNWLVGVFARLGLVGVVLAGLLTAVLLGAIWRVRRWAATDELVFITSILIVATLVEAVLGVVLEAPFGAIPFFWAAGVLLSHPLAPAPQAPQWPTRGPSGVQDGDSAAA
jgi:O-antigen ligase